MNTLSAPAFLQFALIMSYLLILMTPPLLPRLLLSRAPASRRWLVVLAYLLAIAAASAVLIAGPFKHATPVGLVISFIGGYLAAQLVTNLLSRFIPNAVVSKGIGTLVAVAICSRLLLWLIRRANDRASLLPGKEK